MPSIPPFDIDFDAVRRSFTLLLGLEAVDELEDALDHAVYALCISIKMVLKRKRSRDDGEDTEMNEMLHALMIVNELPILEDPRYMDRCAKIFYSTMSELPVDASVKIVRMWSTWHTDELSILLNRSQQ